jgi:hypothetical protein
MKASRLALSLLTAIVFLSGCFDSGKQVSGSNFRRVINQRLAGHPDCWGLTAGNAVDVTTPLRVAANDTFPPVGGDFQRELIAAQAAGLVSLAKETGQSPQGEATLMFVVTVKKPEAWDKQNGLCVGHRVVERVGSWLEPTNNTTEAEYHWHMEPADGFTLDILKAAGFQLEGDSRMTLRLTDKGWEVWQDRWFD